MENSQYLYVLTSDTIGSDPVLSERGSYSPQITTSEGRIVQTGKGEGRIIGDGLGRPIVPVLVNSVLKFPVQKGMTICHAWINHVDCTVCVGIVGGIKKMQWAEMYEIKSMIVFEVNFYLENTPEKFKQFDEMCQVALQKAKGLNSNETKYYKQM